MSFQVTVKPTVLQWARESLGLSAKDVAVKLKIGEDDVKNWEAGVDKPTIVQVEKLARVCKRPLAVFLLPEPPEEPPLPKDFRTVAKGNPRQLHQKTFLAIRKARMLQQTAIELQKELGYPIISPSFKAKITDDPEMLASKARDIILPKSLDLSKSSDSSNAFEIWKRCLEEKGILVFQISISQREIKGFSLIEGEMPAIAVNRSDEANSKIFSLFHETAHILLNESGLCDMLEEVHSHDLEKFCNHFAGAFLVPSFNLLSHPLVIKNGSSRIWTNQVLSEIADFFKVSREVVLRRLLIHGKTTQDFYRKWREENVKDYKPFGRGGRNPVKACVQERGKKFVAMVFKALDFDRISILDTADYLGVKLDQIPEVRKVVAE